MHSITALYQSSLHYVLVCLAIVLSTLSKRGSSLHPLIPNGQPHGTSSPAAVPDQPRTPLPSSISTNAGITVHISQKALTYFTGIAESAFPALVEHRRLPDQSGTGWSISELRFQKVATPTMNTALDPGKGFQLRGNVPEFTIFGHYQIGYGWFGTSGFLDAHLTNLTFSSLVTVKSSANGRASLAVESCNAAVTNARVEFHGAWSSGLVNSISGYVEKYLEQITDELICAIARQAAATSEDPADSPDETPTVTTTPEPTSSTNHHRHPNHRHHNRSVLPGRKTCLLNPIAQEPSITESSMPNSAAQEPRPTSSTPTFTIASTPFSMNMSLIQKPVFSQSFVSLGLDGSMLYKENQSPSTAGREPVSYPVVTSGNDSKMLNLVIRDAIPNTFLQHIFANNLATVDRNISFSSLPPELQGVVSTLCFYCKAHITGGLSEMPQISISRTKGVELGLNGWLRSELLGMFTRLELFLVNAAVHAKVFPYVEDNKLVANTLFDQLNLDSSGAESRISKILGFFLEETVHSMSSALPATLFSQGIQNELKLVYQGGIPLPKMMGLEFTESKLEYDDGAIIIETDLQYDPTDFIKRIKDGLTRDAAVKSVDKAAAKAIDQLSSGKRRGIPLGKQKPFFVKPTAVVKELAVKLMDSSKDYFIKPSQLAEEEVDNDYSGSDQSYSEEKL